MKLTLESTSADAEFLTLPADSVIQVAVESINTRDVAATATRQGWTKLNFKFKILELPSHLEAEYGVLVGSSIFGSVPMRFSSHPDNKLRAWAETLLDLGDLTEGFELDTDMLVGRKARAVVANYPKKAGGFGQEIVGLLPLAPVASGYSTQQPAFAGFPDEPPF